MYPFPLSKNASTTVPCAALFDLILDLKVLLQAILSIPFTVPTFAEIS
jgi:hypothetical protein